LAARIKWEMPKEMAMGRIRPIRIEGDVAYVPLTKGHEAIIDAADVPLVSAWNWYAVFAHKTVYAQRDIRTKLEQKRIRMHRVILPTETGMTPDHIDRNGLNNRRSNLRPATPLMQRDNQDICVANKTGFKGVAWDASRKQYRATTKRGGKSRHLGYFLTPEIAHEAYLKATQA
jgi:hypothetical protein